MGAASNRRLFDDGPTRTQTIPTLVSHADPTADDASASPVRFDSSSMAVTALVILSALFFLGFLSVYAHRFCAADHEDDDQLHRRPRRTPPSPYRGRYSSAAPGLDPMAVRTLPLMSYSGAAPCVVCLSEFEEKETVKAIPGCGHVFHPDCIDAWLCCHGSCPLCRSTKLFGVGFGKEVHLGVPGGGGTTTSRDGTTTSSDPEMAVEVGVAAEGDGSEERGGPVRKKLGWGRSDSWCCRTEQAAASLRRSRSL